MYMHVDDNLISDIQPHIEDAMAASIDSNFQVLGNPEPKLRKTSLAEDKFFKTALASLRGQLGLLIDTRRLTVGITEEKRIKLNALLSQFGPHKRRHKLQKIAELVGHLNYLTICSTWSAFCYIRIQEALIESYLYLYHKIKHTPRYKDLVKNINNISAPGFVDRLPYLLKEKAILIWKTQSKVELTSSAIKQIQDIQTILNQPDRYT